MNIFKKMLWVLLAVLVLMQFFRPTKNQSAAITTTHIYSLYPASSAVQAILTKACNDCHSNNTHYPWYANIQPVAWWLNSHIKDGKQHLNFSEFGSYTIARQDHKLEECADEVAEGGMPLSSYTLIHTNAKLTAAEKQQLLSWWGSIRDSLKAKYPTDSLKMPAKKV